MERKSCPIAYNFQSTTPPSVSTFSPPWRETPCSTTWTSSCTCLTLWLLNFKPSDSISNTVHEDNCSSRLIDAKSKVCRATRTSLVEALFTTLTPQNQLLIQNQDQSQFDTNWLTPVQGDSIPHETEWQSYAQFQAKLTMTPGHTLTRELCRAVTHHWSICLSQTSLWSLVISPGTRNWSVSWFAAQSLAYGIRLALSICTYVPSVTHLHNNVSCLYLFLPYLLN